jgi:hypothetical protein
MSKTKILSCILAVSLIAASLGACSKEETGEVSVPKNQKETMAKVVSLDGDQMTVILADTPEKASTPSDEVSSAPMTAVQTSLLVADDSTAPQSAAPDGEPPQGRGPGGGGGGRGGMPPEDGATPPEGARTPPEGGSEIQFTGGEVTFSLSSDLKVTKGTEKDETEIDLSEIKEGSVIMFTTVTDEGGNEVIDFIRILE